MKVFINLHVVDMFSIMFLKDILNLQPQMSGGKN